MGNSPVLVATTSLMMTSARTCKALNNRLKLARVCLRPTLKSGNNNRLQPSKRRPLPNLKHRLPVSLSRATRRCRITSRLPTIRLRVNSMVHPTVKQHTEVSTNMVVVSNLSNHCTNPRTPPLHHPLMLRVQVALNPSRMARACTASSTPLRTMMATASTASSVKPIVLRACQTVTANNSTAHKVSKASCNRALPTLL